MTEETQGMEQAPAAAPDAGQAPTVDQQAFAELQRANEKMAAELAKVRQEAADRRVAARDADAARLKALEDKGEYEEAAKLKDARIAELEALE